jgi:hypothetical protein
MNKTSLHLQRLSNPAVDTITIKSHEFKALIGLQLPKTATNYRAFWANPKNKKRVQSLLGISSGYTCTVKFKERIVVFRKEK